MILRNRHFLHAADILHVDQSSEVGLHLLVIHVCAGLFLHGEPNFRHIIALNWGCFRANNLMYFFIQIIVIKIHKNNFVCWDQVSSWGGYVFLINLIPLHVLVLMLTGRFSHRIYVAYCTVYCLGTILSMQISFVGFQVRS